MSVSNSKRTYTAIALKTKSFLLDFMTPYAVMSVINNMRYDMGRKRPLNPRGQMKPFTLEQVAQLATFLMQDARPHALRDLAMLETGVATLLRSSDLLQLKVADVMFNGQAVVDLAIVQQKTGRAVSCKLSARSRAALAAYIAGSNLDSDAELFPITTRHHRRIVKEWCAMLRVNPKLYSTHSIRRTLPTAVYRKTHNLAACQKLLGHTAIAHTQEYIGVTLDDAFELATQING
jgi:integrase